MVNAKKEIVFHETQIAILQMLIDLDHRISSYESNLKKIWDNDFFNMKAHYIEKLKTAQEMKIRIEKSYQNQNLKNDENKKP